MHFIQLLLLSSSFLFFCCFFENNKHCKMSVSIRFLWRKKPADEYQVSAVWLLLFSLFCFIHFIQCIIVAISFWLLYAFDEIRYGTAETKEVRFFIGASQIYFMCVLCCFCSFSRTLSLCFIVHTLSSVWQSFRSFAKCAHKSYGCVPCSNCFFAQSARHINDFRFSCGFKKIAKENFNIQTIKMIMTDTMTPCQLSVVKISV